MSRSVAKTLVMLTVVVFCVPLWAQFSSSIDGRVVDATQAIVPGIISNNMNASTCGRVTGTARREGFSSAPGCRSRANSEAAAFQL